MSKRNNDFLWGSSTLPPNAVDEIPRTLFLSTEPPKRVLSPQKGYLVQEHKPVLSPQKGCASKQNYQSSYVPIVIFSIFVVVLSMTGFVWVSIT